MPKGNSVETTVHQSQDFDQEKHHQNLLIELRGFLRRLPGISILPETMTNVPVDAFLRGEVALTVEQVYGLLSDITSHVSRFMLQEVIRNEEGYAVLGPLLERFYDNRDNLPENKTVDSLLR